MRAMRWGDPRPPLRSSQPQNNKPPSKSTTGKVKAETKKSERATVRTKIGKAGPFQDCLSRRRHPEAATKPTATGGSHRKVAMSRFLISREYTKTARKVIKRQAGRIQRRRVRRARR